MLARFVIRPLLRQTALRAWFGVELRGVLDDPLGVNLKGLIHLQGLEPWTP